MDMLDLKQSLEDDIARQTSALSAIKLIGRACTDMEDRGFGVLIEVELLAVGVLKVAFEIQCPAGEVEPCGLVPLETPEKLEAPDPGPVPGFLQSAAPVPQTIEAEPVPRKPGPLVAKQGEPWSEAEKQQLLKMVERGVSPDECARRVGRPLAGTKKMITKLMKAQKAATGKIAPTPKRTPKPAPIVKPVEKPLPAPMQKPVPMAVSKATYGPVSPIEGLHGIQLSLSQVQQHLDWLYRGSIDADIVGSDLQLVEMLISGLKPAVVASEFDWTKDEVIARWYQLRGGHSVTLDLQTKLLEALRSLSARAA